MPFRLDDVLLMLWAKTNSLSDILDPTKGQMINSFRPVFTLTACLLTRFAGWDHPFWWHLTLDLSLLIGITFAGLTARYIIQRWYALEISISLYWLAFLPILNVFFWYSDLTYGLEIAFTASAWYFGLRGLYEARIKFWLFAMLLSSLAMLSKEPALVLVHVVLIGTFLIDRHRIGVAWQISSKTGRYVAIATYVILIALTAWVALESPTKANRFFSLSTPDVQHLIRDRIVYYNGIYLSVAARVLLFLPMVYALLRTLFRERMRMSNATKFPLVTLVSVILAVLCFQNIIISISLITFVFLAMASLPNTERERVRRLLPFLACLVIAMGALLVTIQLVKTQLTEAALLTTILSSWAWCVWTEDFLLSIQPSRAKQSFRTIVFSGVVVSVGIAAITLRPKIMREEHLLCEVRDVRQNANDAIQWSAANLPHGSLLAVTDYKLFGIKGHGELTSKDDETKLAEQPTFPGGFVFDALAVLGRTDFQRTFLADSTMLPRVLNAMRSEPCSYLLLQSKLDFDLFHGTSSLHESSNRLPLLSKRDSLIARFSLEPYPCEIWMLRN